MKEIQYNIYIKYYIQRVIDKAIIEAREKYAIRYLAKNSYKQNIKKYPYHMIYDSGFMSRKSYQFLYPCYFQHG